VDGGSAKGGEMVSGRRQ